MGQVRKRSVTEQQKEFVRYHVVERRNPTEAARMAGYAFPKQAAYELTRNPAISPLLRQARQNGLSLQTQNLREENSHRGGQKELSLQPHRYPVSDHFKFACRR